MDSDIQEQRLSIGGYNQCVSMILLNVIPQIVILLQNRQDIADEIKTEAIQVYYQISQLRPDCKLKSVKGKRQLKIIFYCLFNAYINVDCYIDPIELAEKLNMKKTDINKSLSSYTPRGSTIIPPEKCIKYYLYRLNELLKQNNLKEYSIDECVEGTITIIKLCRNSKLGHEWITDIASKTAAIICLYFYLNDIVCEGICKHTDLYGKACFVSFAGIRKNYEIVSKLCHSYYGKDTKSEDKIIDYRTLYTDYFL